MMETNTQRETELIFEARVLLSSALQLTPVRCSEIIFFLCFLCSAEVDSLSLAAVFVWFTGRHMHTVSCIEQHMYITQTRILTGHSFSKHFGFS